ncbi:hypothetical protein [Anaerosporobacter sp.]|uniref:hypothetical protein n=1 Tax=Anaerosporobacter sp. TaxID=1872529 RepID=UPI00286F291D|nr:hypothetical protein [Anaerosporobacter sp.]
MIHIKKIKKVCILALGVLSLTACTKPNNKEVNQQVNQDNVFDEEMVDTEEIEIGTTELENETYEDFEDEEIEVDDLGIDITNDSYFFESGISQQDYSGTFMFYGITEQNTNLNIIELASLDNGILYELVFDAIEGVPDDRLRLGYFYVQEDKIYKMDATEENRHSLEVMEELPYDSVIVCQEEGLEDFLDEEELGFHQYIEIDGDMRIYHSYNNQVESGYYETFTWEMGRGLVNYRSGYGAESESMELQLME